MAVDSGQMSPLVADDYPPHGREYYSEMTAAISRDIEARRATALGEATIGDLMRRTFQPGAARGGRPIAATCGIASLP